MTSLDLTLWFRRRMLPLVLGVSLVGSISAPMVYYVQKRHELVMAARLDAERVSALLAEQVLERPRLWRYDTVKIAERLASEGLAQQGALVVQDLRGMSVPVRESPEGDGWLWGRHEVIVRGQPEATVWVGAPTAPLHRSAQQLAAVAVLLSGLLGVLLIWIPSRALAAAEARIAALVGQLTLTLREEERGRIARDLHDGAGQALTAARLHLLSLRKSGAAEGRAERFEAVARHIDEALEEIRRSTAALRPPALAELGLSGALTRHGEAVAAATGLEVIWNLDVPATLEAHIETALYRIIQECLTNTSRHANASHVQVDLRVEGSNVRLTVEDDGRGLDPTRDQGGGLTSISERARLLGGEARFLDASPGLRVDVVLPLKS